MISTLNKFAIGFLLFFIVTVKVSAQPEEFPQDEVPVDGGVGLLMAAGAAWGIKKLKERK